MPTIVVGYDGSALGRQAVRQGVRMAQGGRVIVVHAYDAPPPTLNDRWRELLGHEHEERGRAVLDKILVEGDDELGEGDVEARLQPGRPADALLAVAAEVDADGIVVGSHGYGPMSALLGSVSHDLLRSADRPVTVLPPACAERMSHDTD